MARVLINIPRSIRAGETIAIRTLIQHGMESGYRPDGAGGVLARDIITSFTASFEGEEVFSLELSPAVAANPFITFSMLVPGSGTLRLRWRGDGGFDQSETRLITVT
jgi:sulfur-oxidizing protein SoxZ